MSLPLLPLQLQHSSLHLLKHQQHSLQLAEEDLHKVNQLAEEDQLVEELQLDNQLVEEVQLVEVHQQDNQLVEVLQLEEEVQHQQVNLQEEEVLLLEEHLQGNLLVEEDQQEEEDHHLKDNQLVGVLQLAEGDLLQQVNQLQEEDQLVEEEDHHHREILWERLQFLVEPNKPLDSSRASSKQSRCSPNSNPNTGTVTKLRPGSALSIINSS